MLEVEADARPIKTTEYQQAAHTLSHRQPKNKGIPTVSRSKLKGGGSEMKSASRHNPTHGVTGNATLAMSRDHLKVRQSKTTSAPPQFHFKGNREKTAVSVSRNPLRVEHRTTAQSVLRNASKEKALPTASKTAQAISHNVPKIGQGKTKQAESLKPPVQNQSQINEDLKGPRPMKVSASPATTVALSSTLHVLKNQTLAKNKTSVALNTSEKLAPSAHVNTRSRSTVHPSQVHLRLASSLMFYSKASSSVSESSSKFLDGNDSTYDSQLTTNVAVSCKHSEILQDVSPPAGQETALGPVPDMRTCIELSCDHVGGDVAYMRSSQCFVITCQSRALCQVNDLRPGSSVINTTVAYLRKRGQHYKGW